MAREETVLMIHAGHAVDYSAVHRVRASNVSMLRGAIAR